MACLLLSGCEMIDYHPYDVRIDGETDINAHHIEQIERDCLGKDTIRFVTMGDSQRWYDETVDFVNHLNQRDDIDFVIHGGDLSDFGVTDEFLWQRDILNGLKVPYVALSVTTIVWVQAKRPSVQSSATRTSPSLPDVSSSSA